MGEQQFDERLREAGRYIESREGYVGPAEVAALSRDSVLPGLGGEAVGLAVTVGYCGKNKPSDDFVTLPLGKFENSMYMQSMCKGCGTVVHNIRVIVGEAMREKQKVVEVVKQSGRIIVPSVITPKNFRS